MSDAHHFPSLVGVISRQFADEAAMVAAAQQSDESLDARVVLEGGGKTQIQGFLPHRQKI
jgi:hypothetical protein